MASGVCSKSPEVSLLLPACIMHNAAAVVGAVQRATLKTLEMAKKGLDITMDLLHCRFLVFWRRLKPGNNDKR